MDIKCISRMLPVCKEHTVIGKAFGENKVQKGSKHECPAVKKVFANEVEMHKMKKPLGRFHALAW